MSHAKLSPSSSERWIKCPGSVRLSDVALAEGRIKPAGETAFSREGSIAHALADQVLTNGGDAFEYEGKQLPDYPDHTIERDMCTHVQAYVDFVKLEASGKNCELRVEQRVEFTDWVPDGYGTSDAVIIGPNKITCIDLKYGKGVKVDAFENTQAILYALGAWQGLKKSERKGIKAVRMVIYQPRLDHVDEWEIDTDSLLRWGERIAQAAEEAQLDDARIVAGDGQCRWCPVAPICKANYELLHKVVGDDFDNLTPANLLSDDDLRKALDAKASIVAWLSAVEDHVKAHLESGQAFPGFKLVRGRSVRAWKDEGEAADTLEMLLDDAAYERKLLTPAKAEKVLGKKLSAGIQELIVKPEGKPTLVPESDPRQSVNLDVANDFE